MNRGREGGGLALNRLLRRLRERRDDRGMTLVEVLVASALTIVVMTIVVSAFASTQRLFRAANGEYVGQTDVRTTIERLGRDLRNARSIAPGASQYQLELWIDSNSDYVQQASEIVTWQIVLQSDGVHYNVTRSVNGSTTDTAQFVISNIAFQYQTSASAPALTFSLSACTGPVPTGTTGCLTAAQAATVQVVSADVVYRPFGSSAAKNRHTFFSERLRNVE